MMRKVINEQKRENSSSSKSYSQNRRLESNNGSLMKQNYASDNQCKQERLSMGQRRSIYMQWMRGGALLSHEREVGASG